MSQPTTSQPQSIASSAQATGLATGPTADLAKGTKETKDSVSVSNPLSASPSHHQGLFHARGVGVIQAIRADIHRYQLTNEAYPTWSLFLTSQGLWLSLQYRTSRWVDQRCHWPIVRPFLKVICAILENLITLITGCELPNKAVIGPGLFIPHPSGIIIHTQARIGKNCNLSQQVTVGFGGRGDQAGTPTVGNGVYFGAGAKVFGPIDVGDNVAIGANAVVNRDIPNNAVAVGIPAKVISYKGAQDFVAVD
ncbi:MAG: serine O-acetyltransferase [Cyanobacteria bacterium P01_A01_bin.105]